MTFSQIDTEEGSGSQNNDLNVEFEDVLLKEPISLNEVPSLDTRLVLSSLCKDVGFIIYSSEYSVLLLTSVLVENYI